MRRTWPHVIYTPGYRWHVYNPCNLILHVASLRDDQFHKVLCLVESTNLAKKFSLTDVIVIFCNFRSIQLSSSIYSLWKSKSSTCISYVMLTYVYRYWNVSIFTHQVWLTRTSRCVNSRSDYWVWGRMVLSRHKHILGQEVKWKVRRLQTLSMIEISVFALLSLFTLTFFYD